MDRRSFLAALGASAVVVACSSTTQTTTSTSGQSSTTMPPLAEVDPRSDLSDVLFSLGVASGDPMPDRVMLWTRLSSDPLDPSGLGPIGDVEVAYDVATDETFERIIASGTVTATEALGHSVHLDVTGLEPDTWYAYRFRIGERVSALGRTRTLPEPGAAVEQFRFVAGTCQDFQWGCYGAWENAANEDALDAIVFLGDYVYEYSVGDVSPGQTGLRVWANDATHTLDEYRVRYAQVKADPSLQRAHQIVPWIVTWDDHEVSNNYAGDVAQHDVDHPRSAERRRAAYQAWYENMPVRLSSEPTDFDELSIYRSFQIGSLASAIVIETREHADPPPCREPMPEGTPELAYSDDGPSCDERIDPERSNLGEEQEAWLIERLTTSATTWNIVMNPTMLGGLNIGTRDEPQYTRDMWDGYVAVRNRVLKAITEADVSNPVVVTGDWHAAFVLDVIPQDTTETLMPEFVVTAISSVLFPQDYREANDHVRYFRADHGYTLFTVTPDELTAEYRYIDDVWDPLAPIASTDAFVVSAGDPVARAVVNTDRNGKSGG